MIRLIHIAPERLRRRIERSGLRGYKRTIKLASEKEPLELEALYVMPQLQNPSITYQWVRELRRWRGGKVVAVTFKAKPDEEVYVGRYGTAKKRMALRDAVAEITESPWGNEIIFERRVSAKDVLHISDIRQDIGWVENPDTSSHYDCVCIMCLRAGSPKLVRRCRALFEQGIREARKGTTHEEVVQGLSKTQLPLERVRGKLEYTKLFAFTKHDDAKVRAMALWLVSMVRSEAVTSVLKLGLKDEDTDVRESAVYSLSERRSEEVTGALKEALHDEEEKVLETAIRALLERLGPRSLFNLLVEQALVKRVGIVLVEELEWCESEETKPLLEELEKRDDRIGDLAEYVLGRLQDGE